MGPVRGNGLTERAAKNMNKRQQYADEYLWTHLQEICDDTPDDESLCAFRIALTISLAHDAVDSVHQMIFTDHLTINKQILQNAFDYFSGAAICQFESSDEDNPYFQMGKSDREASSETYREAVERVKKFRAG